MVGLSSSGPDALPRESLEPWGKGLVSFSVQARALVLVLIGCVLVEIRERKGRPKAERRKITCYVTWRGRNRIENICTGPSWRVGVGVLFACICKAPSSGLTLRNRIKLCFLLVKVASAHVN